MSAPIVRYACSVAGKRKATRRRRKRETNAATPTTSYAAEAHHHHLQRLIDKRERLTSAIKEALETHPPRSKLYKQAAGVLEDMEAWGHLPTATNPLYQLSRFTALWPTLHRGRFGDREQRMLRIFEAVLFAAQDGDAQGTKWLRATSSDADNWLAVREQRRGGKAIRKLVYPLRRALAECIDWIALFVEAQHGQPPRITAPNQIADEVVRTLTLGDGAHPLLELIGVTREQAGEPAWQSAARGRLAVEYEERRQRTDQHATLSARVVVRRAISLLAGPKRKAQVDKAFRKLN